MRPHSASRAIRTLALVGMALGLAGITGAPSQALGEPSAQDVLQLNQAAQNPATATAAIPQIRAMLAGDLDPNYVPVLRGILVQAMVRSSTPVKELLAATDTLDRALPEADTNRRVYFLGTVADALIERGEQPAQAVRLAERALRIVGNDTDTAPVRAAVQAILGKAQLANGETTKAIATLTSAAAASAESASVLYQLGRAYEKSGSRDRAISSYIRSLGAFPADDSSAAAPLRALYQAKNGGLAGLDEKVTASRRSSRKIVALDGARHERMAPPWKLPSLDGTHLESAQFKGKVLVVDFWGSWCGPCRMELPLFQAAYEKYRDQGVVFVGINWERATTNESRLQAAKQFVDQSGFTFPVVLDHDYSVSTAYSVQAFPSLYVIDKTGKIRYRNVGFSPQIDALMGAQIESLLEE